MRRKMFSRGMMPIKSAPHFSKLKMFGGDIGIDEFRENLFEDVGPANTKDLKSVASVKEITKIEMVVAAPNRATDDASKMWEINNSKANNEPLRLSRAKPLKREQNNLASLLGLKRK